jgi:hypothetical protein
MDCPTFMIFPPAVNTGPAATATPARATMNFFWEGVRSLNLSASYGPFQQIRYRGQKLLPYLRANFFYLLGQYTGLVGRVASSTGKVTLGI